jgi:hypothetical protein
LLCFPRGIGRKGSGVLLVACRRERQENGEEGERGERERRDRHVAEVVDPLHAAVGGADGAGGRLRDDVVLDEDVVHRHAGADDGERHEVARGAVVAVPREHEREERQRVHADPLEPAHLARDEPGDLGEEQRAAGGDRGDDERRPQLVAPEPRAHAFARDEQEQDEQDDERLADHAEARKRRDDIVCHGAMRLPCCS